MQGFYNRRRRELPAASPNAAHEALAVFDIVRPGELLIVTRNIDDLHERAGPRTVIHTHGELLKARCTVCTQVSEQLDDIVPGSECPVCGNAGHLRPHIVRVGEEPLGMATMYEALAHCAVFLAIGVPGSGEPVQSFAAAASRGGGRTLLFPGDGGPGFDEHLPGPLAETVPAYVQRLLTGG